MVPHRKEENNIHHSLQKSEEVEQDIYGSLPKSEKQGRKKNVAK